MSFWNVIDFLLVHDRIRHQNKGNDVVRAHAVNDSTSLLEPLLTLSMRFLSWSYHVICLWLGCSSEVQRQQSTSDAGMGGQAFPL